jgi:hypothetical protein
MKLLSALFLVFAFSGVSASAGVITTSLSGLTVYGATNYVPLGNPGPTYIPDNFTGNVDILSSPGGGYQTANPVVGNNVSQSGVQAAPYLFGWLGGVAPLSGTAFGSGLTAVGSSAVGFALSDTTVGCCSASYMITGIDDDYVVDANGYNGTFGAYLSISGVNLTANDAAVASAIVTYSINGGAFVALPQLVLAAGGNCNNVAIGGAAGANAAIIETGCNGNAYTGLAIDNIGAVNWAPGTTIQIVAAITAYADPASGDSIDSYVPDATLISDTGATLPGFAGAADTGVTAPTTPEPGTMLLLGAGLAAVGILRRKVL